MGTKYRTKSRLKSVDLPPARVSEELRTSLYALAEHKQTSVSALIREAIILFLQKENKRNVQ